MSCLLLHKLCVWNCLAKLLWNLVWGRGNFCLEGHSLLRCNNIWLVAKSQQFKRICCLLLQDRSLFHPEDEDGTLFQNVSTFFQTTWGHISEHGNLNSSRRGNIKSHSLNFGLWWFLFKKKLLLKTTNFVTHCTHYKELAHNTVQAEWDLFLFETVLM